MLAMIALRVIFILFVYLYVLIFHKKYLLFQTKKLIFIIHSIYFSPRVVVRIKQDNALKNTFSVAKHHVNITISST